MSNLKVIVGGGKMHSFECLNCARTFAKKKLTSYLMFEKDKAIYTEQYSDGKLTKKHKYTDE